MMNDIDLTKVLSEDLTYNEQLEFYYSAYQQEPDEVKKDLILKKLQTIIEDHNNDGQ